MEILGDDEAGLPTPPPRRWPIGGEPERPAYTAVVDVTPVPEDGRTAEPDPLPDTPRDVATGAPATPGAADGAGAPDDAEAAVPPRLRAAVDAVTGPEALGLSGLVVTLVAATTSTLSPLVVALRPDVFVGTSDTPESIVSTYGGLVGTMALVGLALAVAGLLRLRPESPAWTRGVTGAATVLAVLLLVVAAWATWNAGDAGTGFEGVEG